MFMEPCIASSEFHDVRMKYRGPEIFMALCVLRSRFWESSEKVMDFETV